MRRFTWERMQMHEVILGQEAIQHVMTRIQNFLHMTHLRAAAYLSLSLRPPFSASPRRTLSLSLFAFARTCKAGSTYAIIGHA